MAPRGSIYVRRNLAGPELVAVIVEIWMEALYLCIYDVV